MFVAGVVGILDHVNIETFWELWIELISWTKKPDWLDKMQELMEFWNIEMGTNLELDENMLVFMENLNTDLRADIVSLVYIWSLLEPELWYQLWNVRDD